MMALFGIEVYIFSKATDYFSSEDLCLCKFLGGLSNEYSCNVRIMPTWVEYNDGIAIFERKVVK